MGVAWAALIALSAAVAVQTKDNPLVGTWRPVEFIDWDSAGRPSPLVNREPRGYLIYTASGHVSLHLFGTRGFYESYVGIYSVDARRHVVNHQIEAASTPEATAGSGPRPFKMRGDTLVLGDDKTWRRVFVRVP